MFFVMHHFAKIVGQHAAVAGEDDGGGGLFDLFLIHAGDAEAFFEGMVGDDDEVGGLEVVAGGGPAGGVEEAVEDAIGEGVGFEIADGTAGAGEGFEGIEMGHKREARSWKLEARRCWTGRWGIIKREIQMRERAGAVGWG